MRFLIGLLDKRQVISPRNLSNQPLRGTKRPPELSNEKNRKLIEFYLGVFPPQRLSSEILKLQNKAFERKNVSIK